MFQGSYFQDAVAVYCNMTRTSRRWRPAGRNASLILAWLACHTPALCVLAATHFVMLRHVTLFENGTPGVLQNWCKVFQIGSADFAYDQYIEMVLMPHELGNKDKYAQ